MKESSIRTSLGGYFRKETRKVALARLKELNATYAASQDALSRSIPLNLKYVLRVLRRAANNRILAGKLKKKKERLDRDTRDLLGLDEDSTPRVGAIRERISVLEAYRKLHGQELERYHCGHLRVLYEKHGEFPASTKQLRLFVAAALSDAGILSPSPEKHGTRLDEWISTPVDRRLDPKTHRLAAAQAKRKSKVT